MRGRYLLILRAEPKEEVYICAGTARTAGKKLSEKKLLNAVWVYQSATDKRKRSLCSSENLKKMTDDKILRYMGLAARGRLLVNGYNTCEFMLKKGRIKLMILSEDLALGSSEKMTRAAASAKVPCAVYGSRESLSKATGKTDSAIFGVTDENLAKAISEELIRKGYL